MYVQKNIFTYTEQNWIHFENPLNLNKNHKKCLLTEDFQNPFNSS